MIVKYYRCVHIWFEKSLDKLASTVDFVAGRGCSGKITY